MGTAKNICRWVMVGTTSHCSKPCMGEFCKVHLGQIRKSGELKLCRICGKGVRNKYLVCMGCGFNKLDKRIYMRAQRAFMREFKTLAAIDFHIRD